MNESKLFSLVNTFIKKNTLKYLHKLLIIIVVINIILIDII